LPFLLIKFRTSL